MTIIQAFFARGGFNAQSRIASHYWVSPFDSGTSVLKSDKYMQLAESAQLDFLVKTKLLGKLLRGGIGFVNASQLVKFTKPIRVFKRVRLETEIIYSDKKCAYFSHSLFVEDKQHGEVLVKMKFKRGAITVRPMEIIGECLSVKPLHIEAWNQTLEAMP